MSRRRRQMRRRFGPINGGLGPATDLPASSTTSGNGTAEKPSHPRRRATGPQRRMRRMGPAPTRARGGGHPGPGGRLDVPHGRAGPLPPVVRHPAPRSRAAALVLRPLRGRGRVQLERVAAPQLPRQRPRPSLALPVRRGRPAARELRRRRSDTNPTAGGGVGFRQPIRSAGSFRVEAGYERMFGDGWDADTFKVSFGLALRF
jgi:hypothetical protein